MTETKPSNHRTLAAKLAAAAKDVGGKLKADARNKEQGYDYISADKILSVGGQALADQGVSIIPQVTGQTLNLIETPSKKWRWDAALTMVMLVTDGESEILAPWAGWGSDYSVPDKAAYKALTSGHKYFVMKLLTIGEDNEDGEHETEEQPATTKPQRASVIRQQEPQPDPAPVDDVPIVERPQPSPGPKGDKPSKALMERWGKLYQSAVELGLTVEQVDYSTITAAELTDRGIHLKNRIIKAENAITSSQPPAGV